METKKQLPGMEDLRILAHLVLYAEDELRPTFDKMLEEGKKLLYEECVKLVADKAYAIMCDALGEKEAAQ